MGVSALRETAESLMAAGRPASTPVALVESGWTADQRTTVTTLEKAAVVAEEEGVRAPAVVVVGDVVALRAQLGDLHRPTPPTSTTPLVAGDGPSSVVHTQQHVGCPGAGTASPSDHDG